MTNAKRSIAHRIYGLFFDENHNQKKWFVLFSVLLPLLLSVIFSIWGTIISIRSYNFSVEASKNREQIDTMRVMLKELKSQNKLLLEQNHLTSTQVNQLAKILAAGENLNEIQSQNLAVMLGNINDSKVPRLAIEDKSFEWDSGAESDFIDVNKVELVNYGGDILNLRYQKIDSLDFNKNNLSSDNLPSNSNIVFEFRRTFLKTKKQTLKARFLFEDALNNKYYQDLILTQNNDYSISFQLGKMTSRN